MIVLDASAVIEFILATPLGAAVAARIGPDEPSLHAPHLIDLEVAQALRRWERSGVLAAAEAERALGHLAALDVTRYAHDVLVPRVWALRGAISAYDAVYVALGEALDAPVLTTDARLSRASGHRARIELIGA